MASATVVAPSWNVLDIVVEVALLITVASLPSQPPTHWHGQSRWQRLAQGRAACYCNVIATG